MLALKHFILLRTFIGIKRTNRKRNLEKDSGKRWCNICEHTFPSQLKFANHLRRKDEFGNLCRPPPGRNSSSLAENGSEQCLGKDKKPMRRIGIIRKGI